MPFRRRRGQGLVVNPNGWSIQTPSPPTYAPDSSPVTLAVSRAGFDASGNATTYTDNLVLTQRVRRPFPNQATLTPNTVALSDYVYSTDTLVNGGPNQSAVVSPVPVAMWATPSRSVVGNTLTGEIVAGHRDARSGRQVACVIVTATDGTLTVSTTVAATTVSGRTGDRQPVLVYAFSLDITTLTDNHLITVNAKVYPWIGGAASVADSSLSAVNREFSPRYYYKSTSLAASPFLCDINSGGNDGTGVFSTNSATAAASPFLTVVGMFNALNSGAAGKADGVIVRVGAGGPFAMTGSATTRNQSCAYITFTRASGTTRANAIVSLGAGAFRPRLLGGLISPLTEGCIRFNDLTIQRPGSGAFTGEAGNNLQIIYDDCDMNSGAITTSWLSTTAHDYMYGFTMTNIGSGGQINTSASSQHRTMRGVSVTSPGQVENWWTLGCAMATPTFANTLTASGGVMAFNIWTKLAGTVCALGGSQDVAGFFMGQNVWEFTSATTNPTLRISGDSATGNNSHVVVHNNTLAGFWSNGRDNVFYDEGSTSRSSSLQSRKGNIHVSVNTKGDVFVGTDGTQTAWAGDAPNRIHNWGFLYGVGCQGEFSQYIDASNSGLGTAFAQAYGGLGSLIGTSNATPQMANATFTNYQATTSGPTVGAGGGTYTLNAGSPVKTLLRTGLLSHDLAGTARAASSDSTGAYVAP